MHLHATAIAGRHDAPCEFASANVVGSTDVSEMKRNAGVRGGRERELSIAMLLLIIGEATEFGRPAAENNAARSAIACCSAHLVILWENVG